jgi:hypothetical protein
MNKINNCYICLDQTSTYIIGHKCSCKIYAHAECYDNWLNFTNKCIICKQQILKPKKNTYQYYWKQTMEMPICKSYIEFMEKYISKFIGLIIEKCQSLIAFILLFVVIIFTLITIILPVCIIIYSQLCYNILIIYDDLTEPDYRIYNI